MSIAPILWFADLLRSWNQNRRRVRVLVHKAYFQGNPQAHYFIKVTNLSDHRDVEITHVWFASTPRVDMLTQARPLPARLRPDQTWENWVPADLFSATAPVTRLGRVQLANTKVVKSRLNRNVPPVGFVAGAGSR